MITFNSEIIADAGLSTGVRYAVRALERDIAATCLENGPAGIPIRICLRDGIAPECFIVEVADTGTVLLSSGMVPGTGTDAGGRRLLISASDDLGLIYGIYHVSRHFLGVRDLWFWNEQSFIKRGGYAVPDDYSFISKPFAVRFRGWFINDEVLIDDWKIDGDNDKPWEMAFEALLRCGGNMTIPGTDENAHIYCRLASEMGLWITHHHAEPLGARMFARAYPDLDASYDRYPELFEGLWREGIEKQKDYKVIWNLGFRGQGDRPFWADDPAYDTDEKRGRLISSLIRKQYDLIRSVDPDAVCCSNLYGETMELYQKGLLDIPGDVIFIWADNGFGKMVTRRRGRHNPRVCALPESAGTGRHGIYYHASFYDLQAAGQMTMLPNSPEFVVNELNEVFEKGADDYWMINCSNIKPHAYILDLIARIWRDGTKGAATEGNSGACHPNDDRNGDQNGDRHPADAFVRAHRDEYCAAYYGAGWDKDTPGCENGREAGLAAVSELYRLWPEYAPKYGPNADDHAGEQFANHGARVLASALITNFDRNDPMGTKPAGEWLWFADEETLHGQITRYREVVEPAVRGYKEYLDKAQDTAAGLPADTAVILKDTLIWQIEYLYYSYLGALHICDAANACLTDRDYLKGFYEAGLAAEAFRTGYEEMRGTERGVFAGFFNNDCEADIRQSHYVAKGLMSYLRFCGDGPHFYGWQRQFQKGAGGNKVHLILRLKRHLTDEELWELIK